MEMIILALQGCVKIKLNNMFGEIGIEFSIESHKFIIWGPNGRQGPASLCAIRQESDENQSANSSSIHRKEKAQTHTTVPGLSFTPPPLLPSSEFGLAG